MKIRMLPPSGVPLKFTDIVAGIKGIFRGQKAVEQFRTEICRYFGVRHCFPVSSGRAALSMLLQALRQKHPERDEVALPAYTSFSVPSAVANSGLRVALYDLDRETLTPDITSLSSIINDRTLCIVVCHLYGYPCDIEAVLHLAHEKGIPVVDDAAQSMGAVLRGRLVGTIGDAGLFSMSRGKNITSVDGGIVVTNSAELAGMLEAIPLSAMSVVEQMALVIKSIVLCFLLHPRCYWIPASLPALDIGSSHYEPVFQRQAYTPFQAVIGRRMLLRLKDINDARRKVAHELMRRLDGLATFIRPVPGAEPVYLRLPILKQDAGDAFRPERGIVQTYPFPLNEIKELQPLLANSGHFPAARYLSQSIMTLPTHQYVSQEDITGIVASLSGGEG